MRSRTPGERPIPASSVFSVGVEASRNHLAVFLDDRDTFEKYMLKHKLRRQSIRESCRNHIKQGYEARINVQKLSTSRFVRLFHGIQFLMPDYTTGMNHSCSPVRLASLTESSTANLKHLSEK
ncbi:hypothetical protein AKJ16_DCAP00297 [Drosera capensis]